MNYAYSTKPIWALGATVALLSGLALAGSAASQGKHGGFAGCSSYTRDGRHVCTPLDIPDHVRNHGQQRMNERAEQRRQRHHRRHGAADAPDLETALRRQVAQAGGSAGLSAFILPDGDDLAQIPQDPKNPLTAEKIELGGLLFHETGIALNPLVAMDAGTYSCSSCHHADAGFGAGIVQGLGEGGMGFGPNGSLRTLNPGIGPKSVDVQPISTPTTLNTAWQSVMLHNGAFGATGMNSGTEYAWAEGTPIAVNRLGYEGLESQAIAGLAVHRLIDDTAPETTANSLLTETQAYVDLFARAFPDEPQETRVRQETAGLAIAAYERSLIADQAPFQDWLRGDETAMTDRQKLGASVFFGDGQCVQCHSGPSLAGMQFSALGLNDLDTAPGAIIKSPDFPEILGRGSFTGLEADMFTFKVPPLYNLRDDVAYGHGSSIDSIRAFLDYMNAGVPQNPRVPETALDPAFQPLGLSEGQLVALTDFIENALHDPSLDRYVPDALPSGQCFPDNDAAAREDPTSHCLQ